VKPLAVCNGTCDGREKQLPSKFVNEGYKDFEFFVCPISDIVLDDEAKHS
jgi:hypothetical protein